MQSWKEIIEDNIYDFREYFYAFLSVEEKKSLEISKPNFNISLIKPCQIVVIDLLNFTHKGFIIIHSEEFPDMEVAVLDKLTLESMTSQKLREVKLLQIFDKNELDNLATYLKEQFEPPMYSHSFHYFRKIAVCFVNLDSSLVKKEGTLFLSKFSSLIIKVQTSERTRKKWKKNIESTVKNIKRDAETIPEKV